LGFNLEDQGDKVTDHRKRNPSKIFLKKKGKRRKVEFGGEVV